jgi:type IX secretion system PorP/SprF family membrane protein
MMRKPVIYLLCALCLNSFAQQLPQYSQYMLNQMAINPAVAGKDEFAEVRSNNRHQWIGITDAPRTYMLTLHGPVRNKNMGIGMNLFTDIVGPTRRTGLSLSYAYHLKLNKEDRLSMGLSAGILQWGIDGSKITLRDEDDQQLYQVYQNTIVPDFGAGIYYHRNNKFYIGLSLPQLHQAPIKLYPKAYKNSKIVSQLNLNGAYLLDLTEDFTIEPSFLFKYEIPAPPKIDVGLRVIYRDMLWLGSAYRHRDAVSAIIGYMYEDYLLIGYSYDFTTTDLKNYSTGTHELMLGLRFSRNQSSAWKKSSN